MAAVKISDADIANVAGSLPNWQIVARKLGFGGEDIEDIETSHRAPADQRKAFVRKWIWKNGKAATYGKLCTALEELDEQGAAEKIHEIGSERSPAGLKEGENSDSPACKQVQKNSTQVPHPQPPAHPPPPAQPPPPPQPQPPTRLPPDGAPPVKDSYEMKCTPKGVAIIINNHKFHYMNERTGTDKDAKDLSSLFKDLGFSVQRHDNQTTQQMRKVLDEVAKMDHSAHDCLIVAILSHGDNGMLYGKDSEVEKDRKADPKNALAVESLSTYFDGEKCPTLKGKPKLFILQACRGSAYDKGVDCVDGGEAKMDSQNAAEADKFKILKLFLSPQLPDEVDAGGKLPITADMLYAYSTVPGYYAWRNSENGSVFIQTFIDVLRRQYKDDHLTDMLTMVNDQVAMEYESHGGMKQMSSFTSQLRKKLYFLPRL